MPDPLNLQLLFNGLRIRIEPSLRQCKCQILNSDITEIILYSAYSIKMLKGRPKILLMHHLFPIKRSQEELCVIQHPIMLIVTIVHNICLYLTPNFVPRYFDTRVSEALF